MPAFYLTTTKREENVYQGIQKYFETKTVVKSDQWDCSLFHNIDDQFVDDGQGNTILCIGVCIYKNSWNRDALTLLLKGLSSGQNVVDILKNTRGQFCLVIAHNNKFYVCTDRLGTVAVYMYRHGNDVEVSTFFLDLAKNNTVTPNMTWIAQLLSQDAVYNEWYIGTLANEITLLDNGTVTEFGPEIKSNRYYDLPHAISNSPQGSDLNTIIDNTGKILVNNLNFLSATDRVHCDITGGFDTRTILAILLNNHITPTLGNMIPSEGEHKHLQNIGSYSDLGISQKISDTIGIPLNRLTETEFSNVRDRFYRIAYELCHNLYVSYTWPRRLGYASYVKNTLKRDVFINGLYGTETLAQTIYNESLIKNLNPMEFFHAYFPYLDIMKDDVLTEKDYYSSLYEAYTRAISGSHIETIGNTPTYLFYLLDFKTAWSPRYFSSFDAIIPAYSPYAEANFFELLVNVPNTMKRHYTIQRSIIDTLNPKLAEIDTSHGYPASRVTLRNFYRFIRILNPWEPNLQYVSPFARPMNKIKRRVKDFLKTNKTFRGLAILVFKRLHMDNDYWNFELSQFMSTINQIGNGKETMKVFRIVDRNKLEAAVKKNPEILNRIIHLEKLLNDISFI